MTFNPFYFSYRTSHFTVITTNIKVKSSQKYDERFFRQFYRHIVINCITRRKNYRTKPRLNDTHKACSSRKYAKILITVLQLLDAFSLCTIGSKTGKTKCVHRRKVQLSSASTT